MNKSYALLFILSFTFTMITSSKYCITNILIKSETLHRPKNSSYSPEIICRVIGTVYPNIPLSSASLHGHPQSSLGATLGVRMSATAYGNHSTVSSVWPIGTSRLNLRPRPLSI